MYAGMKAYFDAGLGSNAHITVALLEIVPIWLEFGGRNIWKLQSDLGCFPHKLQPQVVYHGTIFSKATAMRDSSVSWIWQRAAMTAQLLSGAPDVETMQASGHEAVCQPGISASPHGHSYPGDVCASGGLT
jgi:hypothetical protein